MVDPIPPAPVIVDDPKRPYKAWVAVAVAVLIAAATAAQTAFSDQSWDVADTITVILAALGALGVYFVENPKVAA